jgi:hypothetical protein
VPQTLQHELILHAVSCPKLKFDCPEQDNENWNYEEIYLQVDSENKIAQKLYIKTSK